MHLETVEDTAQKALLRINNAPAIALAFGDHFAEVMARHVERAFATKSGVELIAVSGQQGLYELSLEDIGERPSLLGLTEICREITKAPFRAEGHAAVANVRLLATTGQKRRGEVLLIGEADDWSARYRSDMKAACALLDMAAAQNILLRWLPVRRADVFQSLLHYQAVPTCYDEAGEILDCQPGYEAAARLGLSWIFDSANLANVVAELERDSGPTLCVRLSVDTLAGSADFGSAPWGDILQRLQARPDVAARLVVELPEASSIRSMEALKKGLASFRRLGVSVSVAGFGNNSISLGQLLALRPDIVKTSGALLGAASASGEEADRLAMLIQLLQTAIPSVVMDGVDTQARMDVAQLAGAEWVSGQNVGSAAFGRSWRVGANRSEAEADFARAEVL